jgi:MGT family glycosyltransferase
MTKRRFLLVTWDGSGNTPPEFGVMRRLTQRGHDVRVLGDPTLEKEAAGAGCTFTPWTTAPHLKSRRPEDAVIKDWQFRNPLQGMDVYLKDFFAGPALRWAADVEAVLKAHSFDAAIVDFALPAAAIPIEARTLPLIGLVPNIWILPTKGIPPLGPGFMPSSNPLATLRDAALRAITTRLFNKALPSLNAARAVYGLAPADSAVKLMVMGQRMLLLTSPAFDFTSPYLPSTVAYAGPVLDDPAWATDWQPPWSADDTRPLVVVGLSSGFQDQAVALNRIADALATLPVRALVTLGYGIEPDAVPSRKGAGEVVVVRRAPHSAIIPKARVLVTHCGHGTTMKGLAACVPMLCLPMGRDQNDTAARVVYRGAGIRLKPTASSAAIAKAVRALLNDPRYREAAAALGAKIASGEGCVDAVTEIEQVASSAGRVAAGHSSDAGFQRVGVTVAGMATRNC